MSLTTSEMTPADIAAVTGNNRNNDGMFGDNGAWWIIVLFLFAGWGRGGLGGFGGGFGGTGYGAPCATQADLAAGFNNSAVLSGLNDLKLGQAQGFNGVNTAILQTANGIDNAICTLGYQNQAGVNALSAQLAQCCCDTRAAIGEVNTGIERTGWNLSKQIGDCCCDLEKMNMQNRFDAQAYNCNTLQAIDKLGDRIIDYMANEKLQSLREENQALRLSASQSNQNAVLMAAMDANKAEILRRTGAECPTAAYLVQPPTPVNFPLNCCGQVQFNGGCNNGCGGF